MTEVKIQLPEKFFLHLFNVLFWSIFLSSTTVQSCNRPARAGYSDSLERMANAMEKMARTLETRCK